MGVWPFVFLAQCPLNPWVVLTLLGSRTFRVPVFTPVQAVKHTWYNRHCAPLQVPFICRAYYSIQVYNQYYPSRIHKRGLSYRSPNCHVGVKIEWIFHHWAGRTCPVANRMSFTVFRKCSVFMLSSACREGGSEMSKTMNYTVQIFSELSVS